MKGLLKAVLPAPLKRWLRAGYEGARRLGRGAGGFALCAVRGERIRLWVGSDIERYRADTYATKEPDTLDWIDAGLKPGAVFFDVGANVGVYSLYAAAKGARVYAFEPESQNFAHLCRNAHENGFKDLVPVCAAISDKDGVDLLHVSAMEAGTAFHGLGAPSEQRIGGAASVFRQGALAVTLDTLIHRFGLPVPALLKIDVDGIEGRVLRGARELLRKGLVESVLVEVNGHEDAALVGALAVLKECGYEIVSRGPAVTTGTGETSRNCVFRRSGR